MTKRRDPSKRYAGLLYDDDFPADGFMPAKHRDPGLTVEATCDAQYCSVVRMPTFPVVKRDRSK